MDQYETGDVVTLELKHPPYGLALMVKRVTEPTQTPVVARKGQIVQRLHLEGGFTFDVVAKAA